MSGIGDGDLARAVARSNSSNGHGGGQGGAQSGDSELAHDSSTGRLLAAYDAMDSKKVAAQRSTVRARGVCALSQIARLNRPLHAQRESLETIAALYHRRDEARIGVAGLIQRVGRAMAQMRRRDGGGLAGCVAVLSLILADRSADDETVTSVARLALRAPAARPVRPPPFRWAESGPLTCCHPAQVLALRARLLASKHDLDQSLRLKLAQSLLDALGEGVRARRVAAPLAGAWHALHAAPAPRSPLTRSMAVPAAWIAVGGEGKRLKAAPLAPTRGEGRLALALAVRACHDTRQGDGDGGGTAHAERAAAIAALYAHEAWVPLPLSTPPHPLAPPSRRGPIVPGWRRRTSVMAFPPRSASPAPRCFGPCHPRRHAAPGPVASRPSQQLPPLPVLAPRWQRHNLTLLLSGRAGASASASGSDGGGAMAVVPPPHRLTRRCRSLRPLSCPSRCALGGWRGAMRALS